MMDNTKTKNAVNIILEFLTRNRSSVFIFLFSSFADSLRDISIRKSFIFISVSSGIIWYSDCDCLMEQSVIVFSHLLPQKHVTLKFLVKNVLSRKYFQRQIEVEIRFEKALELAVIEPNGLRGLSEFIFIILKSKFIDFNKSQIKRAKIAMKTFHK
ncbi:CLUMA_CG001611, isoform A [Clunio marinus]|uniref:CLUMA_CG001611, isoform A n=1 Tax=Clunio marinus TaxID=568069 RepID=A0A1J1HIF6_9DIPT|nr:CLUMA_CG001611, isoform A [Clunio marinus]